MDVEAATDRAPALEAIAAAGVGGPTGDNCQPWRLTPKDGGFDLEYVPTPSFFDFEQLASWASCGAFLESARLAGSQHQVDVRWTLKPEPAQDDLWARVSLRRNPQVAAEPLAGFLGARHSNRERFSSEPLAEGQALALEAEGRPTARVGMACDGRRETVRRGIVLAERIRAGCRPAHLSMYPWLRFSREQVEQTRDGLDVRTLGVTNVQGVAMRLLRPWPLMRVAVAIGVDRVMGGYAGELAGASGGLGVVCMRGLGPSPAAAAGQALQRVWLRATGLGLWFSVLGALPLFALRVEQGEGEGFTAADQRALLAALADLRSVFGLEQGDHPLVLFRVGRDPKPCVRSLRRPLPSFVSRSA